MSPLLQQICETFDTQSGVACRTPAHSTRPDRDDVKKVVSIVLKNKLLVEIGQHDHRSFKGMKLNSLHQFDVKKTECWIKAKIKEYHKYKGGFCTEVSECDIECNPTDDLELMDDFEPSSQETL